MRQVEHLAWAMGCGKSRHWLEELATLNVPMLYVDKSLWDPSSLGTLGVYKATYPIFFSPNCYSGMDSTALHQLHSPSGITKTNRQGRRPGKIACRACHDRKKRCDIAPPYHQCTHCRKENQCCIPRDPIERYVNEDNGILKVLHVFTNCLKDLPDTAITTAILAKKPLLPTKTPSANSRNRDPLNRRRFTMKYPAGACCFHFTRK